MTGPGSEAHLLLVDADPRVGDLLRKYLVRHGFWVTLARDAVHADRLLGGLEFDLIVLGVPPTGQDAAGPVAGFAGKQPAPVLAVVAGGVAPGPIRNAGAREVLSRPFEPQVLLDLINRVLDRTGPDGDHVRQLRFGRISYDPVRGEMWRGDERVRLTVTESRLMRIFSARPSQPVSRSELVEDTHKGEARAQERAIDVQITRLRRKIEPDPKQPRYLQTVRGAGYLLAPD